MKYQAVTDSEETVKKANQKLRERGEHMITNISGSLGAIRPHMNQHPDSFVVPEMLVDLITGEETNKGRLQRIDDERSFAYEVEGDEAVAVMPAGDTCKVVHATYNDERVRYNSSFVEEPHYTVGVDFGEVDPDNRHHGAAIAEAWEMAENGDLGVLEPEMEMAAAKSPTDRALEYFRENYL